MVTCCTVNCEPLLYIINKKVYLSQLRFVQKVFLCCHHNHCIVMMLFDATELRAIYYGC